MSGVLICSRAETVRRVNLMIEKGDVVDELVQLGRLLQEEKHLSEQLNGQDSVERSMCSAALPAWRESE